MSERAILVVLTILSVLVPGAARGAGAAEEWPPPPPPPKIFGGAHVGAGYYNMSAANGPTTAEFSGPALDVGVRLGYRLSPRLGAFGAWSAGVSTGTSYLENGADKAIGAYVWTNSIFSAGGLVWIPRFNVFACARASLFKLGIMEATTRVALAQSHFGPGALVEVGKHWSGTLGLITVLRVFYGSATQLDRDFRWQVYSVTLAIGTAYSPFWSAPAAR